MKIGDEFELFGMDQNHGLQTEKKNVKTIVLAMS